VPLLEALQATGIILPPGTMANPTIGGFVRHEYSGHNQFVAQGKQIAAVQFYKLGWKTFARKSVDPPTLAKKACVEVYDRDHRDSAGHDMYEIYKEGMELSGPYNGWKLVSGEVWVEGTREKKEEEEEEEESV
jgi:hypothetical protein